MPYLASSGQVQGDRHPSPLAPGTGLPSRLLRPLWLLRAHTTYDEFGAATKSFVPVEILGRIARGAISEDTDQGREASVGRWRLFTNFPDVITGDRVGETDRWWEDHGGAATDRVWEVDGEPYAVYAEGGRLHHYEVTVRRADG